jgi:hypothetical protein
MSVAPLRPFKHASAKTGPADLRNKNIYISKTNNAAQFDLNQFTLTR